MREQGSIQTIDYPAINSYLFLPSCNPRLLAILPAITCSSLIMSTLPPPVSQSAPPATRLASSPFNKPDADIILRSGDGVDFCVRRHILFEASPVFEFILSIPQPSTDVRPIVELVEDEKTLNTILRICYPIVKPKAVVQLEELERAVKAAQKYEMELPLSVLTDELLDLAKTSPFAV